MSETKREREREREREGEQNRVWFVGDPKPLSSPLIIFTTYFMLILVLLLFDDLELHLNSIALSLICINIQYVFIHSSNIKSVQKYYINKPCFFQLQDIFGSERFQCIIRSSEVNKHLFTFLFCIFHF